MCASVYTREERKRGEPKYHVRKKENEQIKKRDEGTASRKKNAMIQQGDCINLDKYKGLQTQDY